MTKPFCGAVAVLTVLLAAPACKHKEVPVVETIEEAPKLASTIEMADRTTSKQLTIGFYDLEADAWRWSKQQFAVTLRPPQNAAQNGAVLSLRLTIPKSSFDKLGKMTLSASLAGTALPPETYAKAGDFVYTRDVPSNLLAGDAVKIDFQLDKSLPPGDADKRELGVVVAAVGLVAK